MSSIGHPKVRIFPVLSGHGKRPSAFKKTAQRALIRGKMRTLYTHPQHGRGFFSSIGNFFKNAANKVADAGKWTFNKIIKPVGNFARDHKLVSKGLSMIPDPRAQIAATGADLVGLGRKRKRKSQRGGRRILST